MIRFFVLFTVLLVGLFTLEILQPAEKHVILPFTSLIADVSAWIIQFFDDNVTSVSNVIRDKTNGFGVRIERGCNGVEALIILFAAIFAFPAPIKNKLVGFTIGFFGIQGLNMVRIVSLFYLGQWNQVAFEWFHLYLFVFPFHPNGYGDALVLVNDGWDAALTGPGYDSKVFERVRRTGEDAPEAEFGRVYVQGLSETNQAESIILLDKLPTPGGDHCHGLRRLYAPLGREIWTVGSGMRFIPESQWSAFSRNQIEMLIAARIPREEAEKYYSEKALDPPRGAAWP